MLLSDVVFSQSSDLTSASGSSLPVSAVGPVYDDTVDSATEPLLSSNG